ncbi:MAG: hypothetical protein MJZ16_06940, partial [Bacteroidales bacterium]|nr:hypothetical protein [Bacteroidales bacterium]
WTRDVSYSILHSLAQISPEVSMTSLLAKVNANNRIIQDTGTGGAWPCSTDRTTWVLAAWEVYKVTGDKQFLDRIFPIIKNTIDDDFIVAYNPRTQLMKGETSYLDWREQEYPLWARPADIYNSEALGTNCVHYQAIKILSEICRIKEMPNMAKQYADYAEKIKDGINKYLWMQDKGYYAIYQFGRNNLVVHPQMEVLGESFAILFDVADKDRTRSISQNVEEEAFGTPMMYPNLKDQGPYHNDAMWPFVQGYWLRAQAKAGNEEGVTKAISSIYRLASFGLTNYENMVIYNGDYHGLSINSPRQLWSVAANLAIVPGVLFGIQYEADGIEFHPLVPKTMAGKRHLSNFKYRGAVLDMTISGYGNHLKSFKLDGVETKAYFPGSLTGNHTIEMVLDNVQPEALSVNMVENDYQLATPVVTLSGNKLTWTSVDRAACYYLLKDGKKVSETTSLEVTLPGDGEYSVVAALDSKGTRVSYMSEPIYYYQLYQLYQVEDYALVFDPNRKQIQESEGVGNKTTTTRERADVPTLQGVNISGHQGGCAMITRNENILITIPIEVKEAGTYALDWRYANGNGPINTENKCATRVLAVDEKPAGVSVFPQRGHRWTDWGWSNPQIVELSSGRHIVTLTFTDAVENMNITVNQALLDALRVTKID